jgi:hypothetical protein
MIISASRRTDIPAFFSEWFINRINDGSVLVRNPMNPYQVSRIDLSCRVVDCIVFWTKNPAGIIPRLNELKRYNYYFQFSINAYGNDLEPNCPELNTNIKNFILLSEYLGPERVIWRYDPIILTGEYSITWHKSAFSHIASRLSGFTKKCVISFYHHYRKCERNMRGIETQNMNTSFPIKLGQQMRRVAEAKTMTISTCASKIDLTVVGIQPGKCVDDELISEITGKNIDVKKDKTQRDDCGCVTSIDIGSYNTCMHGCLYCYANFNSDIVKRNCALHDPDSPLIFGSLNDRDKVTKRKV